MKGIEQPHENKTVEPEFLKGFKAKGKGEKSKGGARTTGGKGLKRLSAGEGVGSLAVLSLGSIGGAKRSEKKRYRSEKSNRLRKKWPAISAGRHVPFHDQGVAKDKGLRSQGKRAGDTE